MFFCAPKTEDRFVQGDDLRVLLAAVVLAFTFFCIFSIFWVDIIVSFVVGIVFVVLCVVPLIHG